MDKRVSHITLLITDQDDALNFYAQAMGTEVRGDETFPMGDETMRWVTVGLPGQDLEIVLSRPMQAPGGALPSVGDGNMVVLSCDDVEAAVEQWRAAGGAVTTELEDLPWGRSALLRDPDGNPWNFVQTSK